MTTVNIDLTYPGGAPRGRQKVLVALVHGGGGGSNGETVIGDTDRVDLDADGHASIDLVPNEQITPAGTFYRCTVPGSSPSIVRNIVVPVSATPVSWADPAIQVESPVPPAFTQTVIEQPFPGSIDGGVASSTYTIAPTEGIDGGSA